MEISTRAVYFNMCSNSKSPDKLQCWSKLKYYLIISLTSCIKIIATSLGVRNYSISFKKVDNKKYNGRFLFSVLATTYLRFIIVRKLLHIFGWVFKAIWKFARCLSQNYFASKHKKYAWGKLSLLQSIILVLEINILKNSDHMVGFFTCHVIKRITRAYGCRELTKTIPRREKSRPWHDSRIPEREM